MQRVSFFKLAYQDRTGHKSLDGLRKYESISEQQKQEACRVLATCGSDQEIGNKVRAGIAERRVLWNSRSFPTIFQR